MDTIEKIIWKNKILAYIIRNQLPDKTSFITPTTSNLQVGFIVYKSKSDIPKHIHKPLKRILDRTEEVLVVRKGYCRLDIYHSDKTLVATREVHEGDVIIFIEGGHGFHVYKDTVLLEIKQGPYNGTSEKERF